MFTLLVIGASETVLDLGLGQDLFAVFEVDDGLLDHIWGSCLQL